MVRVVVSKKVEEYILKSKSGLRNQIKKKFFALKENPRLGDYIFGLENIDCREIKVEGLRFFTVQYRDKSVVLDLDEFREVIKVVDVARKNKSKEQQMIIDQIKERISKFGMNL